MRDSFVMMQSIVLRWARTENEKIKDLVFNPMLVLAHPKAVLVSLPLDVFYFYFSILGGKIPNLIGLIAKGGWNCTKIPQNATSLVFQDKWVVGSM